MKVNKFKFNLKKLNRQQVELADALFSYLPKHGMRSSFGKTISAGLEKHIGSKVSYRVEAFSEMTFAEFTKQLPKPTLVAVVGMMPSEAKVFLDLDLASAQAVVDRMLGGKKTEFDVTAPLAEIEAGVLQYLFVQLLAHLHQNLAKSPKAHFRFEQFLNESSALQSFEDHSAQVLVLSVRIKLPGADSFVRICIPSSFVQSALQTDKDIAEMNPQEHDYLLGRLQAFGYVRLPAWAEVGKTILTPPELLALEPGDVIVMDEAELVLQAGKPAGKVIVRIGKGNEHGMLADLELGENTANCHLIESTGE